jgi:hypothetical protein
MTPQRASGCYLMAYHARIVQPTTWSTKTGLGYRRQP